MHYWATFFMKIATIPADNNGNKLFLKELRTENNRVFIKYKSTYNDMPFSETEIFAVDGGKNFVITGDDGTILYRFSANWLDWLNVD